MIDKEILKKAIKKAVQNGYKKPGVTMHFYKELEKTCEREAHWYYETKSYYQLIFSHNFAKAFWGEEEVDDIGRTLAEAWETEWKDSGHFTDLEDYQFDSDIDFQIAWMYHLRQMVLSNQPLKYLEKFL